MGLYYFVRWLDAGRRRDGGLAAVATSLAALFKVYALYLGAAYLFLLVRRKGWRAVLSPQSLLIAAVSVIPVAAWDVYGILTVPDRPGQGRNLVASGDLLGPLSLLVTPEYYTRLAVWWIDWTLTPLFGLCAVLAAALAIGHRLAPERVRAALQPAVRWPDWLTAWWLGVLVYLLMVRQGVFVHDYYQIPVLPPLAVTAALGAQWLWERTAAGAGLGRRWARAVAGVLAAASFGYAVQQAHSKAALDLDELRVGQAAAALRKPGEYLAYWDFGERRHNQVLYYSGGPGWRLESGLAGWEELKPFYERGARHVALDLSREDWDAGRAPVPVVRELIAAGHLIELRASEQDVDRYGRPRRWAIYRIEP